MKQKEKLQRFQNHLRIKEDEVKSLSEYFEHCKQNQKEWIVVLRERELYLQGHVCRLENELRDLKATISLLVAELEKETLLYLQANVEAAFAEVHGAFKWKHLVEKMQRHIKGYLERLKQKLNILMKATGGSSEEWNQGDKYKCVQDVEKCLTGSVGPSGLLCNLKSAEINFQDQVESSEEGSHVSKQTSLQNESVTKEFALMLENEKSKASGSLVSAMHC